MMPASRSTARFATAAAAVASALAYPFLPRRVATHFDVRGRPDRSVARQSAVLRSPAIMAAVALIDERVGAWPGAHDRDNVDSGERAREQAVGLSELALLFAHLAVLARALGLPLDLQRVQRAIYSLLIVALGNVMPKLPRNGVVGIRTPWTLADPAVWERTHRLAGYLCTLAGLIGLASLPAAGKRAERIPMVALLGAIGFSAAYSALAPARVHRRDDDPPFGGPASAPRD
jgi:uncharacterized membrane protein